MSPVRSVSVGSGRSSGAGEKTPCTEFSVNAQKLCDGRPKIDQGARRTLRRMGVIYCLESEGLVWYVGSTRRPEQREDWHRRRYGPHASADIPTEYEFSFKVLETCDNSKMKERERHYYDMLRPLLNIKRPMNTEEERKQMLRAKYERFKMRKENAKAKGPPSHPKINDTKLSP